MPLLTKMTFVPVMLKKNLLTLTNTISLPHLINYKKQTQPLSWSQLILKLLWSLFFILHLSFLFLNILTRPLLAVNRLLCYCVNCCSSVFISCIKWCPAHIYSDVRWTEFVNQYFRYSLNISCDGSWPWKLSYMHIHNLLP